MHPIPTDIQVLQKSRCVQITFSNGLHVKLPCAYLRINSPSADNQQQRTNDSASANNQQCINIIEITPVGNYAIKFAFDDGHNTGLFTWEYLYQLANDYKTAST